ncbi:hypothetical protein NFI96_007245 [Prochilodus magdalenae]|nr:hypothetical protein NFI96_007245 [Prochilodus magdalenae]
MEGENAATLSCKENKEQAALPQKDIKEYKAMLENETTERAARDELKEIRHKEAALAELQSNVQDDSEVLRRSDRSRVLTEKMLAYQRDEQSKKERRLVNLYEQWKAQARKARQELKSDLSEKHLSALIDSLEERKNDIMKVYNELRMHSTPAAELRRKVDACEAVTNDITKVVFERLTGVNGDFDAEYEGRRLRELLAPDYAHSIYSSTASESSASQLSGSSCIAAKRADAAAELAAKEAEYKVLLEERRQKEKIRTLEEQHRKELEMQKSELERLKAERDLKAAHARFEVYDREIKQETDRRSVQLDPDIQICASYPATQHPITATQSPHVDVSSLAQAVQDSIALNRLPMPEPKVFNGNPIEFIEWKTSFMSLIDRKSISTSDKLHYLKRYVSGPAYKCVEGTFYRDDEEAYKDAWNKLNQRVTVKELPAVTPTDALKILESDFRDTPKNDKTVSQEDLIFLDKLKENIRRNEHGHYEMPLPFKERPCLPDNKQLAALRLNHLKRKFIANEKYKHDYIAYMKDLIEKGDVEEVHDDGANGETWYIPHHGIYHPKKPEKLRVVFDCSAKYKGTSLNEHLLPGPDMINNLTGVLIRFREHRIALMCDIEKMFHQFHVQENDRNYLRFLWWKNGDVNTPPHEFRMKVHLFGAVSSPGCANYGLKQLAKEHSLTHPQAAQFIARDFYVDDGVSSFESEEEAIQLAKEAREL